MLKAISIDSDGRLAEASSLRRKRGKSDASKIQQLACHPRHSGVVATVAMNGAILIWTQEVDRPYWSCQALTAGEACLAACIKWHPVKEWHLLAGGEDGIARLWQVPSAAQQAPTVLWSKRCQEGIRAIAWTVAGPKAVFACGLRNGRVQVFSEDPERPAPILTMLAHSAITQTLAWHPVWPGVLATGGRDCCVRVWDLTRRVAPGTETTVSNVLAPASVIEAICGPEAAAAIARHAQAGPSSAYRFPASAAAAGRRPRFTSAREEWSSGHGGLAHGTGHAPKLRPGQLPGAGSSRFGSGPSGLRGPRDVVAIPLGATSDAAMSASAGQRDSPVLLANLSAISVVLGIQWRPGTCLHIAANTTSLGSCVKVWDISRPGIPVAEFNRPSSHGAIAAVAWVPREDLHSLAAARSAPGAATLRSGEGSSTPNSAVGSSRAGASRGDSRAGDGSGGAAGSASAGNDEEDEDSDSSSNDDEDPSGVSDGALTPAASAGTVGGTAASSGHPGAASSRSGSGSLPSGARPRRVLPANPANPSTRSARLATSAAGSAIVAAAPTTSTASSMSVTSTSLSQSARFAERQPALGSSSLGASALIVVSSGGSVALMPITAASQPHNTVRTSGIALSAAGIAAFCQPLRREALWPHPSHRFPTLPHPRGRQPSSYVPRFQAVLAAKAAAEQTQANGGGAARGGGGGGGWGRESAVAAMDTMDEWMGAFPPRGDGGIRVTPSGLLSSQTPKEAFAAPPPGSIVKVVNDVLYMTAGLATAPVRAGRATTDDAAADADADATTAAGGFARGAVMSPMEAFREMALGYRLEGGSRAELCTWNASVARRAGATEAAMVWSALAALLQPVCGAGRAHQGGAATDGNVAASAAATGVEARGSGAGLGQGVLLRADGSRLDSASAAPGGVASGSPGNRFTAPHSAASRHGAHGAGAASAAAGSVTAQAGGGATGVQSASRPGGGGHAVPGPLQSGAMGHSRRRSSGFGNDGAVWSVDGLLGAMGVAGLKPDRGAAGPDSRPDASPPATSSAAGGLHEGVQAGPMSDWSSLPSESDADADEDEDDSFDQRNDADLDADAHGAGAGAAGAADSKEQLARGEGKSTAPGAASRVAKAGGATGVRRGGAVLAPAGPWGLLEPEEAVAVAAVPAEANARPTPAATAAAATTAAGAPEGGTGAMGLDIDVASAGRSGAAASLGFTFDASSPTRTAHHHDDDGSGDGNESCSDSSSSRSAGAGGGGGASKPAAKPGAVRPFAVASASAREKAGAAGAARTGSAGGADVSASLGATTRRHLSRSSSMAADSVASRRGASGGAAPPGGAGSVARRRSRAGAGSVSSMSSALDGTALSHPAGSRASPPSDAGSPAASVGNRRRLRSLQASGVAPSSPGGAASGAGAVGSASAADGAASAEADPAVGPAGASSGPAAPPLRSLAAIESRDARKAMRLLRHRLVRRVFAHCTEAGDVQMCVSLVRVLGQSARRAAGERRLSRWVDCYADLLHQQRLWAPASTILARSNLQAMQQEATKHTTIHVSCSRCKAEMVTPVQPPAVSLPAEALSSDDDDDDDGADGRRAGFAAASRAAEGVVARGAGTAPPADDAGWQAQQAGAAAPLPGAEGHPRSSGRTEVALPVCERCKRTAPICSLCQMPVSGLFVWCQGCGHGGHLEHMQEWFASSSTVCPAGCGHACNLRPLVAEPDASQLLRGSSAARGPEPRRAEAAVKAQRRLPPTAPADLDRHAAAFAAAATASRRPDQAGAHEPQPHAADPWEHGWEQGDLDDDALLLL